MQLQTSRHWYGLATQSDSIDVVAICNGQGDGLLTTNVSQTELEKVSLQLLSCLWIYDLVESIGSGRAGGVKFVAVGTLPAWPKSKARGHGTAERSAKPLASLHSWQCCGHLPNPRSPWVKQTGWTWTVAKVTLWKYKGEVLCSNLQFDHQRQDTTPTVQHS